MMRRLTLTLAILALTPMAFGESSPVRRGASMEEVRGRFGAPPRQSRVILFRRHVEQWHYTVPERAVEFNCVRGEQPTAVRVWERRLL